MKHILLIFLSLLTCASLWAKVAPGENILNNGELVTNRTDTPPLGWDMVGDNANKYMEFSTGGGPGDKCYVRIANKEPSINPGISLRHWHIMLVPGERYRLSCWIKSVDLSAISAGVIVCNNNWSASAGFDKISPNQDWTFHETEFVAPSSPTGEYFVAGFAYKFTGEINFADVKLEAVTEKAQKNSWTVNAESLVGDYLLVAWQPLLQHIPLDNPEVCFKLFGNAAKNVENLELCLSVSDVDETVSQPLVKDLNTIRLPDGASKGEMTISIRRNGTAEVLYSTSYPYALIDLPEVVPGTGRRLNNLCTELVNTTIAATEDEQVFEFATRRNGWIFIAAQNAAAPGLEVVLDDGITAITNETPRLENFREVAAGAHKLVVKGASNGGNLVVRSIAETLNYPPCANSFVPENPPYDWDFLYKHALSSVTTQNGGNIPSEKREWFKAQGYHWLGNNISRLLKDDNDMTQRLEKDPGMNADFMEGVTSDEQFFRLPAMLLRYTRGIHNYSNPKNHVVYAWIVGEPETPGIDEYFVSESLNFAGGRGKLMAEIYTSSVGSEEKAKEVIHKNIVEAALLYKELYPNIFNSFGIVLGNFNQVPRISLHHHPEVDMKYFLDMQFNLLANAPELDGLGLVGYWGSYYADHEFHRWSFELLRHYVIEGKTTMLSDKYGYKYIPGHVINGDFRGTFDGWKVRGNVTLDKVEGLAKTTQGRWNSNDGVGDTFAVFSRKADEVSTLKQTAKGLIPGQAYLLQFCTFDVDYVRAKNSDFRDFGIRATLGDGATIREDLSWQHIDKRGVKGSNALNHGVARPNLHHIVFIADAEEVEITLDNRLSLPGENLGVNFFTVLPFRLED